VEKVAIVGIVGAVVVVAVAGTAALIQWAWNYLLHGVFGAPEIGFWHAIALMVLIWLVKGAFQHSSNRD
jgi:uncharacterized membrane protein